MTRIPRTGGARHAGAAQRGDMPRTQAPLGSRLQRPLRPRTAARTLLGRHVPQPSLLTSFPSARDFWQAGPEDPSRAGHLVVCHAVQKPRSLEC